MPKRVLNAVIITLEGTAAVIGRVNVDAIDLAGELLLKGLDLFLASELVLEGKRRGGRAAGFFDLAVEVFDLTLQSELEIIGPTFELLGLGFKEAGVALGDATPVRAFSPAHELGG